MLLVKDTSKIYAGVVLSSINMQAIEYEDQLSLLPAAQADDKLQKVPRVLRRVAPAE